MKKNQQNSKGFSLVVTLLVMGTVSLIMTMLIKTSQQKAFTVHHRTDRIKAIAYAEGGIEYALGILIDDFDKRSDTTACTPNGNATVPLGEGSYTLELISDSPQYCVIKSTGNCGNQSVEAVLLSEDFLYNTNSNPNAEASWPTDLMTIGGAASFNGNLHGIKGRIIAKGKITTTGKAVSGSNLLLVSATSLDQKHTIPGSSIDTALQITTPNPEDYLLSYKDKAYKIYHNQAEADLISWDDVSKNNNILFFNFPSVTLPGVGSDITIVSTGSITFTSKLNNKGGDRKDLSVIASDNITCELMGGSIHGLFFSGSDISINGNLDLKGQLICGGEFSSLKNNTWGLEYDPSVMPPDESPTSIGPSAWQK